MACIACAMAAGGMGVWALAAAGAAMATISGLLVYQVHRAVGELRRQSQQVRHVATEAEKHYAEVLRRIIRYVEMRDRNWQGHSENVARMAGRIGKQMGLSAQHCEQLVAAGQLHDIGLLAIPDAVLLRNTRFGVDEFRAVQKHSEVSYEVLRPLEHLAGVLPAIRSHHERFNGTGYPDALAGEAIPLDARILAVADAYDAMTHDRPHRAALAPLVAMRELRRCTPAGYDPRCVEAMERVMGSSAGQPPATEESVVVADPAATVAT
jgi:HD-GYP domain-containing protein (c-di-GMP phosphodiesterase class II)